MFASGFGRRALQLGGAVSTCTASSSSTLRTIACSGGWRYSPTTQQELGPCHARENRADVAARRDSLLRGSANWGYSVPTRHSHHLQSGYFGMSTVSITWMTPLLAGTSAFTTLALLIFRALPLTAI